MTIGLKAGPEAPWRITRMTAWTAAVALWIATAHFGAAAVRVALAQFTDPAGTGPVMEFSTVDTKPVPPSSPARPSALFDATLARLQVDHRATPHISNWRSDLERGSRRLLEAFLARPDSWRDELTPILAAHGVPEQFIYLALVESGMDPDARSPAAAVGLWQFTAPTARQYGLVVDEGRDERLDWRRSTVAAGRYLRDLYERFGSWELAAAAYNAGPGRVSRALRETGSESYWGLLEARRLPAETRAYVPRFLAVVQLAAAHAGRRREGTDASTQD